MNDLPSPTSAERNRSWTKSRLLVLAVLIGLGTTVVVVFTFGKKERREASGERASQPRAEKEEIETRFTPGITRPKVEVGNRAEINAEFEVVGVMVEGKARAYLLAVLSRVGSHVVNDLIGDIPITINYCDKCDLVRVFTSEKRGEPIPLTIAGRIGKTEQLLLWDGEMYRQRSLRGVLNNEKKLPLQEYPFERMIWSKWKEKHPDTDVFIGPLGNAQSGLGQ